MPALMDGADCDPISKSSPFYQPLAAHAKLISTLLRAARKLAPVAIVTSSMTSWVSQSCALCLPELDIEALLSELDIPVYYSGFRYNKLSKEALRKMDQWSVQLEPALYNAPDDIGLDIKPLNDGTFQVLKIHAYGLVAAWNIKNTTRAIQEGDRILDINGASHGKQALDHALRRSFLYERPAVFRMGRPIEDIDLRIEAKRIDMAACLQRFRKSKWSPNKDCNVISVGDSVCEREALKIVMEGMRSSSSEHLCKTVHLLDRPTLKQLSSQLRLLMNWLPQMLQSDKSFDSTMDRFVVDTCASFCGVAKCLPFRSVPCILKGA
jgi:hypothetical protein